MIHAVLALGALLSAAPVRAETRIVLSPTRYELTFDIDYAAERLHASARVALENRSTQPVTEASLMLYRLLEVRDVRDGAGAALPFRQSVVAFEDDGKRQVNQVIVTLSRPLPPGARTDIRVDYDGYLLGYAETGWRYVRDRIDPEFTILREDSCVYPIPGYPSHALMHQYLTDWEFTYSTAITVPNTLTVANGGRLDGVETHGDRATYRYSSLKPSWRMDFAIAKYSTLSSKAVRVFYLPGDREGALGVAQAAEKSLDIYAGWFGPLRESSALTFIEIPDGWGSQADVTTIIQTAAAFRDPKQHREVYHEIGHLWNVNDTVRPSPRLDEGLASFLEFLVDQEITGEPRVDARANRVLDWLRAQLPAHSQWREVPLVDYGRKGGNLTDLSYSVGAMFFDLLYRLVGSDTFNAVIREFNTRFTAGGSTQDLMDVARKNARLDLSQLIDDWITTTHWADRVQQFGNIQDLAAYYRSNSGK